MRIGLLLLATATLALSCGQPPPPRDIVLITLDTTRADHLGSYGRANAATHSLDRIADEGSRFVNAACQVPLTTASHATIMTGLLPPAHGVRDNGTFSLPETANTLAERLKVKGFATHAVTASFAVDHQFGLAQGFDTYDDELTTGGKDLRAERAANAVIDRGIALLQGSPGPTFLWLHLYDPHSPYAPPEPYAAAFPNAPYAGEIAYMDAEIGRLIAALEATGRWPNALVIVVGDHGEALGEHGEEYHGTLLYDGTARVPLLVKWPGGGRRRAITTAVGTHDIVPTVLASLGSTSPELEGRDLGAIVDAKDEIGRPIYMEALTAELHYGWARLVGLRTDRHKLIQGARTELYDLQQDPREERDLATEEAELAAAFATDLAGLTSDAELAPTGIDPEAAEKLAALGYVSAGGTSAGARAVDPVSHIHLENIIIKALEVERTDPAAAMNLYREVLGEDDANKMALLRLAVLEENNGAPEAAVGRYLEIIRHYPDVEVAYSSGLRLLGRLGRLEQASDLATAGLAELPRSDRLRLDLAAIARARGDLELARRLVDEVPKASSSFSTALYVLATIEAGSGHPEAALAQLALAVEHGYHPTPRDLLAEPAFTHLHRAPEFLIVLETLQDAASRTTRP